MQLRQKISNLFYPVLMAFAAAGKKSILLKPKNMTNSPSFSFYDLQATGSNGQPFLFENLRGRWVLVVNTASLCGYTAQYASLEKLQSKFPLQLQVIGFPSNDFGNQEPGSNADIAEFCRVSYGIGFPLMDKQPVSGASKQPVYEWLTNPEKNGWNNQEPAWNFCKYLISPEGELEGYFASGVDPLSAEIQGKLQK